MLVQNPQIVLFIPGQATELDATRAIIREYAASLGVDLCFQDFDAELASLPGAYGEPRGAQLLVTVGNALAGCCALRPLETNACEIKRLYVRPAFRGPGLGRQLAEAMLDCARRAGYDCVLLDTLTEMEAARALYQELGFEEVPPYHHNPLSGGTISKRSFDVLTVKLAFIVYKIRFDSENQ